MPSGRGTRVLARAEARLRRLDPPNFQFYLRSDGEVLTHCCQIQAVLPGAANSSLQFRDPEELRADLDLCARLRSQLNGSALTNEDETVAIHRDNS